MESTHRGITLFFPKLNSLVFPRTLSFNMFNKIPVFVYYNITVTREKKLHFAPEFYHKCGVPRENNFLDYELSVLV